MGQTPQGASPAEQAEQPAGTPPGQSTSETAPAAPEEVVITGFRNSLARAVDLKRKSNQVIDAITAEDIADFPDANLAESIQRLPGISIDRDNGEGRTITVRGLGGDFQQVRLNGADALSITGGGTDASGANRSRGFDFNTFASELFGGVTVTKTTSAANDEGSLGAIIDLTTGRPLTYKKDRYALGLEGEFRENGRTVNPRLTGLVSKHITDNLAVLGSVAYQDQRQQIDFYQRSIGAFDYVYRSSQLMGVTPNTFGFARPSTAGTGATFGSDPAAYALLTPNALIPALPSINRQDLHYRRLGATGTVQWKPTSRTEITLDGVYSKYDQHSTTAGITTIGLNRNGTNANYARNALGAANTATGLTNRIALYPNCAPSTTVDCGQSLNGGGLVAGTRASYNPNNLNPFDYYNSTSSPGYVATGDQTGFYTQLIGRPNTKVRAANVNGAGIADYLVLDDVDWRSSTQRVDGTTKFYQGTLNLRQDLGDRLHFEGTAGYSRSEYKGQSLLAEFNAIDQDNYTFDERAGGKMPVFSPGFDVASPQSWTLVKGLSTIRYLTDDIVNSFRVARGNLSWEANDEFTVSTGLTYKRFAYSSTQARRNSDIEAINPTLAESKLLITDLGRTMGFGKGLNVPDGTPTSFYAPDIGKFINQFGINCNCINKWADFRALVDARQANKVTENDLSGFLQFDWNGTLLGRPFRGNAGTRIANTVVRGSGSVGGAANGVIGTVVSARNEYTDFLPALNVTWEVVPDTLVRFATAKVIARPQLAALTPGTTSFPTGLNATTAPQITVGNPYLSPYRATNFDLAFEHYFGRGGLISVGLFAKKLASFPQQIAGEYPLQAIYDAATLESIYASITSTTLLAYTRGGGVYAVRQYNDAPGGTIKGVELNVQSNFTFLPAPFDNFGVTANYTHISSKLNYLTNAQLATTRTQTGTASNTFATGPFLNTSPNSFNATLYYEDKRFSARVSGAYRTRYVTRFPLASGTCSVGLTTNNGAVCNSPVVSDFGYREKQLNIDAAMSYSITDFAKLTLEGRNLTNAPTYSTEYAADPVSQGYQSTGRVITAGIRLVF
ncbi:TonB-dependent receptor domain-containing protein [Sphingomonas crusticola]|uniref:TonB-dependent receptor domain-containing protein n=1 Tax=Sphingomonas crusticola TaxID=1697973 RepID=UPI001F0882AC|nr:TonB-dependent receptor [Sphingomonas crusticola]